MGAYGFFGQPIEERDAARDAMEDRWIEQTAADLPTEQRILLEWLGKEDFSQYGECCGKSLDALTSLSLVQIHEPGEHQRFIANGTSNMHRAVSVTALGRRVLKASHSTRDRDDERVDEQSCPGHVASKDDPKVCGRCGVHIDSLRPDNEGE